MITDKPINKELNDKDLKQICGGSGSSTSSQKDTIKQYLTVKCMYNVARTFELNLKSALALAINTSQNNINISVIDDSVSATCNGIEYDYDEIMSRLTSYYGS